MRDDERRDDLADVAAREAGHVGRHAREADADVAQKVREAYSRVELDAEANDRILAQLLSLQEEHDSSETQATDEEPVREALTDGEIPARGEVPAQDEMPAREVPELAPDDAPAPSRTTTEDAGARPRGPHTVIRLRDVRRNERRRVLLPIAAGIAACGLVVAVWSSLASDRTAASSSDAASTYAAASKSDTSSAREPSSRETQDATTDASESLGDVAATTDADREGAANASSTTAQSEASVVGEMAEDVAPVAGEPPADAELSEEDAVLSEDAAEDEAAAYVDPSDPALSQVSTYTAVQLSSGTELSTLVYDDAPQYVDEGSLSVFAGFAQAFDANGAAVDCEVFATQSWMEYPYAVRYEGEQGYWLAKAEHRTGSGTHGLTK